LPPVGLLTPAVERTVRLVTLNVVDAPEYSVISRDLSVNVKPVKMPLTNVGIFHVSVMYVGPTSSSVGGSTSPGPE